MNSDPRNVPSPDPYGSQPSWHGQQPPQGPGGQPPYPGAPQSPPPHGYPGQGQPGGPQQWGPQPQWAAGPPTPPNRGGKGKWILVGLALIAVIAVSIVGTVLALQPDSGGNDNQTPTANSTSDFASANDTGPANIITEDPTCEAWGRVSNDYIDVTESVHWGDRDTNIPADDWTSEQRSVYETVGQALTNAMHHTVNLQKQTPHRVMRELYAQFIAYSQAFVDAIPTYTVDSHPLANVVGATVSTLSSICSAIGYRVAQPLAPLISDPRPPSNILQDDAGNASRPFLASTNSICPEWIAATEQFSKDSSDWVRIDANIPAADWTPEQKAVYDNISPVMTAHADDMEQMGRNSGNAVVEDIATLAAQYTRGYVVAIPNYKPADNFISDAARYLTSTVFWACKATA